MLTKAAVEAIGMAISFTVTSKSMLFFVVAKMLMSYPQAIKKANDATMLPIAAARPNHLVWDAFSSQ